jgi:hypothetical protein
MSPFAASVIVLRRNGRATTHAVPLTVPPLWWRLADQLVVAVRQTWARRGPHRTA